MYLTIKNDLLITNQEETKLLVLWLYLRLPHRHRYYGLYSPVSARVEPRNAKEAPVWLQQLYARAQFRNVFFTLGMRERESVLVNQRLSSGDLCFSGNIRPMPGVTAGFADFCNIPLTGGWVAAD